MGPCHGSSLTTRPTGEPGASACSRTIEGAYGAPRPPGATPRQAPSCIVRRVRGPDSLHPSAHSHSRTEVRECESIGDRRSATSRWSDTGRAARPVWSMRSPSCPELQRRHGSVRDGTALTDTAPEEIERGYSINLGCAHAEWMDTKINLLDTPGYLDFQGDAIAGLAAADGALCVVQRDGRRRGGHRAHVPRGRRAPRSGALRRLDDGQGARRLRRASTSRSSRASRPRSFPSRSRSARAPTSTASSTSSPSARTVYTRGAKTRRIRGDRHPRRGAGAVRPLLHGADRDDRRRPTTRCSSTTSSGERDLARRGDRRR